MNEYTSPFVLKNQSWIIKNVLAHFLRAANLFAEIHKSFQSSHESDVSFDKLKQLSEVLYTAKEQLRLIYRRTVYYDGEEHDSGRYEPNSVEFSFINNIGVLFHKTTVARELKYMAEFYQTDSEDYHQLRSNLVDYVKKLDLFFERGKECALPFMKGFSRDSVILAFLLENEHYFKSTLGKNIPEILNYFEPDQGIEDFYIIVIDFFLESGWPERAKKMIKHAKSINPQNVKVGEYIKKYF